MFDYETFRLKIILHRRNLKLTQAELGELSGISEKNISKLELGKHAPKLKTAISILNVFNTTLASFMGNEVEDKRVLINKIDTYLANISNEDKRFVLDFAKELSKEVE